MTTPGQSNKGSRGLIVAGVALGILASMSGTAGKQCLRFSELQRRKGTPAAICVGKVALAIGLSLNIIIGPLIDMASYALGPQSVIAPLGALDVVWNTLTAPFTLGETLTPRLFFGCVLITGGAVATSLTGSHDGGEFTPDNVQAILFRPAVGFYLGVLAVWLLVNILVLMPRSAAPAGEPWQSGDRLRGLSLGMTAGSIAGNMFCVKAFVEIVEDSIQRRDGAAWTGWLPYVVFGGALVFALSNLYFLSKAMREYEALFMGAVFEGSLIVSACISGVVVFAELESLQTWQVGFYWAAILLITVGIFVVAMSSNPSAAARAEQPDGLQSKEEPGELKEVDFEAPEEPVKAERPTTEVELAAASVVAAPGPEPRGLAKTQDAATTAAPVLGLARPGVLLDIEAASRRSKVEDGVFLEPTGLEGARPLHIGVVPSAEVQATPIVGSCLCADGISCFCGMHLLRSRNGAPCAGPVGSHRAISCRL